jgi:hypothetical protein
MHFVWIEIDRARKYKYIIAHMFYFVKLITYPTRTTNNISIASEQRGVTNPNKNLSGE